MSGRSGVSAVFLVLVACTGSSTAPEAKGQEFIVQASCGAVRWFPGPCMDTFEDDQQQLVEIEGQDPDDTRSGAVERACRMGREFFGADKSVDGIKALGRLNPGKAGGEPRDNGLWLKPRTVLYRCGFAWVFTHEITCHAWKMGCDCEGPHNPERCE